MLKLKSKKIKGYTLRHEQARGYTMIEILIVISIIGFVASAAMYFFNSAREEGRIAGLLQFSDGVKSSLSDSPVAYWSFDNGDATDSWGQYHGAVNGATAINNGVVNGAMSFDGGDSIVTGLGSEVNYLCAGTHTVDSVSVDMPWTTSVWFKTQNSDSNMHVIMGTGGGGGQGICYNNYIMDGDLKVRFRANTNDIASNVSDNKWHLLVVTWDMSSVKAYFDGGAPQSLNPTSDDCYQEYTLVIGGIYPISPSQLFDGLIDEPRVYSGALSFTQIQKLYAEGAKKFQVAVK